MPWLFFSFFSSWIIGGTVIHNFFFRFGTVIEAIYCWLFADWFRCRTRKKFFIALFFYNYWLCMIKKISLPMFTCVQFFSSFILQFLVIGWMVSVRSIDWLNDKRRITQKLHTHVNNQSDYFTLFCISLYNNSWKSIRSVENISGERNENN